MQKKSEKVNQKINKKISEKIKLAIMYGGPGGEHEVSVRSARNILDNIKNFRSDKYDVTEFFISKNTKLISNKILKEIKTYIGPTGVVWPIFHGEFGEGGYVQEVLEKNKIKFIGSGSKASKLAIDKFKTQKVLEKNGILCPKSYLVSNQTNLGKLKFSFPIILKPVNSGSSVDLYKVKEEKDLTKSLKEILKKHRQILLQEFIQGREFTCGVMNLGNKILALPISEVVLPVDGIFDYKAKYATSGLEITPAKIDKKLSDKIKKLGEKVHQTIGCAGVTRTDIILDKKGRLFVLEINTIPGLTKVSFIPEQLRAQGITIPEFVDIMVRNQKQK